MNPTIRKLIRKETYAPALQRFAEGLARPAAFLKKRGQLLCFAGLHATWVLLLCYLLGNTPYSLGDEESFVQYLYIAKEQLSPTDKQLPPDVLPINIAYDKQLVDCTDEYGFPQGQTAITDRTKLLRFLQLAEQNGRYRYILLDVFFGADYATPADSALFATIARMKRIVIPRHRGEALADSLLLSKAAYSDYSTSINEGNFVRYEYLPGGQSSIAWRMYEECASPAWSGDGFFATCNGKLCNRCLFLSFPVPFDGEAFLSSAMTLIFVRSRKAPAKSLTGRACPARRFISGRGTVRFASSSAGRFPATMRCRIFSVMAALPNQDVEFFKRPSAVDGFCGKTHAFAEIGAFTGDVDCRPCVQ